MSPQDPALAALPGWWPEAMLWLGVLLVLGLGGAALVAWSALRRLERLQAELGALASLPELQRSLQAWLSERDDLDLRRIEHLLLDLRDGARRVEDLLLRTEELRVGTPESAALVPVAAPGLGERVVNRLLAMGYERIELVTPHAELEAFARSEGEVRVEARREGVLCKGRVRVRAGRIDSVNLTPAYPAFP